MLTHMLMVQMSKHMDLSHAEHFSAIVYLSGLVHISPVTSLQCGVKSVECGVWSVERVECVECEV